MTDVPNFAKLVPGFDFLQSLVKNAGSALPSIGQWVAPTLDPQELEKRIEELRTVQFWLEQNARMLGATIQALEVQRMTLSTLKTMNVQMTDLSNAMTLKMPDLASPAPAPEPEAEAPAVAEAKPAPRAAKKPARGRAAAANASDAGGGSPAGVVDPMQWWSALTRQFTTLAANALNEGATGAAKNLTGSVVKQSIDAAGETLKRAVEMPAKPAGTPASTTQRRRQPSGQ